LTRVDIVKYQYSTRQPPRGDHVYVTPELAALLIEERNRQAAESRMAWLAAQARACCAAPASLIDRVVRFLRPAPAGC
jgi:hypothetical protein